MPFLVFLFALTWQNEPVLTLKNQYAVLALDSSFLNDPVILKNLSSGLTTTLEIQVEASSREGQFMQGGAKVFIRYELWDEVFLIEFIDIKGVQCRESVKDLAALHHWIQNKKHDVIVMDSTQGRPVSMFVTLRVLPFSQNEQTDAKKWMSRTISAQQSKAGSNQSSKQVMDLIIGTSVKRPTLLEFSWEIPVGEKIPPGKASP